MSLADICPVNIGALPVYFVSEIQRGTREIVSVSDCSPPPYSESAAPPWTYLILGNHVYLRVVFVCIWFVFDYGRKGTTTL